MSLIPFAHRFVLHSLMIAAVAVGSGWAQPLRAADQPSVALQQVCRGLTAPVCIAAAPGDTRRLFVVEQADHFYNNVPATGKVRIVDLASGTLSPTPFLSEGGLACDQEQGLLGLAFDPGYQNNGYVYIACTKQTSSNPLTYTFTVIRYRAVIPYASATSVDPASATEIIAFNHPKQNHNGGWLGFKPNDPDFLYVSSGDGGGSNDNSSLYSGGGPNGNAQNTNVLLGKMLRIKVNGSLPVNPQPQERMIAYGLRNPWRCSFDRATGDLWIGDVGQELIEEIDVIPAAATTATVASGQGINFGWHTLEGTDKLIIGGVEATPPLSSLTRLSYPVMQYHRSSPINSGSTVIGGNVYRGASIPSLQGYYVYADYGSTRLFSMHAASAMSKVDTSTNLTPAANTIDADRNLSGYRSAVFELPNSYYEGSTKYTVKASAFGEDTSGELYICDYGNGRLLRLISAFSVTTADALPATTVGATVSMTLASQGGTTPVTWSVTSGALPAGLSISASGLLSGSPSASGVFPFTVQARDAQGATASKNLSWTVNAALAITTSPTLPATQVGNPYNLTLLSSGGTGTIVWSVAPNSTLPATLTLSAGGRLSGSPANSGSFSFTLRASDQVGVASTRTFSLVVGNTLSVTSSALPAWTRGRFYTTTLQAAGGTPPYQWSATGIPAGLSLAASGVLSGTPTVSGTSSVVASVVDAQQNASPSRTLGLNINEPPTITAGAVPTTGNVGVLIRVQLAANAGTPALQWSLGNAGFPGATISTSGLLNWTPTTSGNFTAAVVVTDAAGAANTRQFTIAVSSAPRITSTFPTDANVGLQYRYDVTAVGIPQPTLSLEGAPVGMSLANGRISWTPTAGGSATVTVVANNGVPPAARQLVTLSVTAFGLVRRPNATRYLNMPVDTATAFPGLLSQTGTFANTAAFTPATAMVPYGVNAPFWSDGAIKQRWASVPTGNTIAFAETGAWTFPAGTVFMKHFDLALDERQPNVRRRLETRLLVQKQDGNVYGVTYRWNDAQSDASVVTSSQTTNYTITKADGTPRTQTWYFPSPTDCLRCHSPTAKYVLGVNTRQLNGKFSYPDTQVLENQVQAWSRIGMFSNPPAVARIPDLEHLSNWNDSIASLENRARSYLDSNCNYCHADNQGSAPASFDTRFSTPLALQNLIEGRVNDPLGVVNAKVIASGSPDRSIIFKRINTTSTDIRMPPLGRNEIDVNGADMLRAWITSLPPVEAVTRPILIDLNGPAVVINGEQWTAGSDTPGFSVVTSIKAGEMPATLVPTADAGTTSMLNSGWWTWDTQLGFDQILNPGTYTVSLWAMENDAPSVGRRSFDLLLENQLAASAIGTLPQVGAWRKYGPYPVTVTDGILNIRLQSKVGNPHASGIEIRPVAAGLPAPWTSADIGGPANAGSARALGTSFTVSGGGNDIWGTSDSFQFVSQPVSGNFTIQARVTKPLNTDFWAKAGVMIRESMSPGAKYVFLDVSAGFGPMVQSRAVTNDQSAISYLANGAGPYWMRLSRVGNVFTSYLSNDGITWQLANTVTIPMNAGVLVGLGVTSHNNSTLTTATFDQVALIPAGSG